MANKPSQYWDLWYEIKREKQAKAHTQHPARLKRAISKRKWLDGHSGELRFAVELVPNSDPLTYLVRFVLV